MSRKWTEEQKQVIDARNCNLLVSAAAGSGKTAVLVQRVIDRLLDPHDPLEIDRLLVVTFTNAAAVEMRQRIRDALAQQLEEHPDDRHLQRQEALVHQAMIMTMHSFCSEVIRNHIHLTGIDPGFRIAEEGEISLLRRDVMRDLLEQCYAEPTDLFLETVDTFASGRDDAGFEKILLRLYDFSMSDPNPRAWRTQAVTAYEVADGAALERAPWMMELMRDVKERAEDMGRRLADALEAANMPDGPAKYADDLSWHLEVVGKIAAAEGYQTCADAVRMADQWDRLAPISAKSGVDPVLKDRAAGLRASVKNDLGKLRSEYFSLDEGTVLDVLHRCGRIAGELVRLTDAFSDAFDQAKREKNLLDFNDLEHMALRLLTEYPQTALEYRERFQEVMTDEYQDCNLVQERIAACVSKGDNRFMVGDVKQSIYRFRLARPELFMEKYRQYTAGAGNGTKIELHRNFRSRSQVLDAVNMVFRQIMAEDMGGVRYDESAMLYPGADFGQTGGDELTPELLLVQEAYPDTDENHGMMIRQEAMCVGRRILSLTKHMQVWDGDNQCMRPCGFGDIAVLLRTVSEWGETFTSVLAEMGIPAVSSNSRGYFKTLEVRTVLSALQAVSNPRQDIPLAAFLRSPMIGLTDEALALIRSACREGDFLTACVSWLEAQPEGMPAQGGADAASAAGQNIQGGAFITARLRYFFDLLGQLRSEMTFMPVHELIWTLLERTGYGVYVQAMPGGEQRSANLELLIRKAEAFEQGSYRGLFHFLRYVENLQEADVDFGEATAAQSEAGAVRIMSIHKSKGLEFPVVFVSGLGKGFNRMDSMSPLVLHPVYGFGCSCIDTVKRVKYPVLYRQFLARLERMESLGEELRILYVAMTRAKEKLIMTGVPAISDTSVQTWKTAAEAKGELTGAVQRRSASNFLDFVIPALLRHKSGRNLAEEFGFAADPFHPSYEDGTGFAIRFVSCLADDPLLSPMPEAQAARSLPSAEPGTVYDSALHEIIAGFAREEEEAFVPVPGSISVSALKKAAPAAQAARDHGTYAQPQAGEEIGMQSQPQAGEEIGMQSQLLTGEESGMQGQLQTGVAQADRAEGALTGAALGTLYHKIMEIWDFAGDADVQRQLETLEKCGKIQKNDLRSADPDRIRQLLESETGARMRLAAKEGRLRRETPFVLSVPAGDVIPDAGTNEPVLVQGVIDVWFEEEDGIVLLDYKSDTGIDPEGRKLADLYGVQLFWYKQALERLVGRPVKESLIWSFELGKEISLSLP